MAKTRLEEALAYGKLRWKIHPCHGFDENMNCTCGRGHKDPKDSGKHPARDKWNEISSNDEYDIKSWWSGKEGNANYNIGLHCSKTGIFVIDVDPRSGGDESYEKLIQLLDEKGLNLPVTVEAITGEYTMGSKVVRGRHIYFHCGAGESLVGNLAKLGMPGIDIKFHGYVMIPGSKHFSGVSYEWLAGRDPWSVEIAPAPEQLLAILRNPLKNRKPNAVVGIDWDEIEEQAEKLDLKGLLEEGLEEGERSVQVYRITISLANRLVPRGGEIDAVMEEVIIAAMLEFNRKKIKPPMEEEGAGGLIYQVRRAINFVRDNPPIYISPGFQEWLDRQGTIKLDPSVVKEYISDMSENEPIVSQNTRMLINKALKEGKSLFEAVSHDNSDYPDDPDAVSTQDGGVPGLRSLSDLGNSRRLVDNFGYGISYTPDLGYKIWSDGYWKTDKEGLYVQEIAKKIPSVIQSEIASLDPKEDPKPHSRWQANSRSIARLKSAIEGAKSDPRIHVELTEWDRNPYLFGTKNGIVDLRDGELMTNGPELHISMKSSIQYIPGYRNDKWQKFLDDVTGGNKEYQKYLQRLVGYSITGLSNLDLIALMYGPPGTGKNTFIESVVKAAGEYSWPLDLSVIAPTNGMTSNSDLYHIAELFGKRLSWVDELPEGEKLKENTLKKLSGSSLMSARSPGGRPFSFYLTAKIWISSNHRPPVTDEAMWRRLIALPFVHVPKTVDPHLKDYLSDPERGQPAVLAWMIEGAADYLQNPAPGANPIGFSQVVYDSTELYKRSEDRLGLFVAEELQEKENVAIPFSSVFQRYKTWSLDQGDSYTNMASFEKKMNDKGYKIVGTGPKAQLHNFLIKGFSSSSPAESHKPWAPESKVQNINGT